MSNIIPFPISSESLSRLSKCDPQREAIEYIKSLARAQLNKNDQCKKTKFDNQERPAFKDEGLVLRTTYSFRQGCPPVVTEEWVPDYLDL